MPRDVRIIDLMLGIPEDDRKHRYDAFKPLFKDAQSRGEFEFPAQYTFKQYPEFVAGQDHLGETLRLMDQFNIERAQLALEPHKPETIQALVEHPDRFFGAFMVDPNKGMEGVRELVSVYEQYGIKGVTAFPSGYAPQVPFGAPRWYPIFAKLVELDLPISVCMGVPGPRFPMAAQHVELLDEVCYQFPDLVIITRHGTEPWQALAVKLMLKWPNLYYSTSAFAPKHYPKEIIDYANTRGADRVMYAGYFPSGLTLERIFTDMPHVPFRDHVWPKFLRDNAVRVFKLDA